MTLYIGQQRPFTVYSTGFWVCVVLVLSVIMCSCHYFLDRILLHDDCHHGCCDYHWDFMAINYFLNYTLGFLHQWSFGSANAQLSRCASAPDILLEYCMFNPIFNVTFGPLYSTFALPTRIFYMGVPGTATGCACGVWFRGLTTSILYVGPLLGMPV